MPLNVYITFPQGTTPTIHTRILRQSTTEHPLRRATNYLHSRDLSRFGVPPETARLSRRGCQRRNDNSDFHRKPQLT